MKRTFSRREFLELAGATAAGSLLAAHLPAGTPAALAQETLVPATPAVVGSRKVRIAVGGWAEQNTKDLLAKTEFSKQTGIDVEVVLRTDTKETELTRLAAAVQAGTSPYDVIDFEDEMTT